jgi:hypothetical protein
MNECNYYIHEYYYILFHIFSFKFFFLDIRFFREGFLILKTKIELYGSA